MVKVNEEILYLYSENARIKINELGKILKKTPQRLKYTLKTLEKEKIVDYPHAIFDYSYFGLIMFRVYFKGGYISEADKNNILNQLNENKYVVAMYELSGEFDLVIEVLSPNPSRFNKEIKKVANMIPTLNNYKVILNVVTHIYPRYYLLKNSNVVINIPKEIIIGGDREIEKLNDNELIILKNLLQEPKIRQTSLANKSELNVKTSTIIFKNLQRKKIIKGFKYTLDSEKLGVQKFRLFLKLHNTSQEKETELQTFLLKTKEVVQLHKTVGDWDLEIDVESFDKTSIRQMIVQMRENFKYLIETFNIMEFYQYYKKSFLPKFIFEKEKEK